MSSETGSTKQAANCPKGVPAPVNVGEFGKNRLLFTDRQFPEAGLATKDQVDEIIRGLYKKVSMFFGAKEEFYKPLEDCEKYLKYHLAKFNKRKQKYYKRFGKNH